MARHGGVGLRLGRIRKRGDAVQSAQGPERLVAARQDLPGIGLMPDVPYDAVTHRVERLDEGHCDFDRAERRREMSAVRESDV